MDINQTYNNFNNNEIYNGFKLVQKKIIDDIESACFEFVNEKTGARLFYVANNDNNKILSTTFRTPAVDDTGKTHILEHRIMRELKENYKKPIGTSVNAITKGDMTTYNIASQDYNEFCALRDAFLNAAFFPSLKMNQIILDQEGWHYEYNEKKGELKYNGVVYNEVKGIANEASTVNGLIINKSILSDTCYRYNSGGTPESIVTLNHKDITDYYNEFYHPSNSYTFLYGNLDILGQLKEINEKYFNQFEKRDNIPQLKRQEKINEHKEYIEMYAVSKDEEDIDNAYLFLNYLGVDAIEVEKKIGLGLLATLLNNNKAALFRDESINKEILKKIIFSHIPNGVQSIFSIRFPNSNTKEKESFKKTVEETLMKIVNEGIEKDDISNLFKDIEIKKERFLNSNNKGFVHKNRVISTWLYGGDPIEALNYYQNVDKIKNIVKDNYFESLIKDYILYNPNFSLAMVLPEKGLNEKLDLQEKEKLKKELNAMSKDDIIQIIDYNKFLRRYYKEINKNVIQMPKHKIPAEKMPKEIGWFEPILKEIDGVKVRHYAKGTDNLINLNFEFDIKTIPEELIPYTQLFMLLLSQVDTENFTKTEFMKLLDSDLDKGQWNVQCIEKKDNTYEPQAIFGIESVAENMPNALNKLNELIKKSMFDNEDDLYDIIKSYRKDIKENISNQGYKYAEMKVKESFLKSDKYIEKLEGLGFYKFLCDLGDNFKIKSESIIENLNKVRELILNKKYLSISTVCEQENYKIVQDAIEKFLEDIPYNDIKKEDYSFNSHNASKFIGIITDSKLNSVVLGGNYKFNGYKNSGALQVLNNIIRNEYLFKTVREIGGAYIVMSQIGGDGRLILISDRDQNIGDTLHWYEELPEFIENLNLNDEQLDSYIIKTLEQLDVQCINPYHEAMISHFLIVRGYGEDTVKQQREEIRNTTLEEIRGFSTMLKDTINNASICIAGSEESLANSGIKFDELCGIISKEHILESEEQVEEEI